MQQRAPWHRPPTTHVSYDERRLMPVSNSTAAVDITTVSMDFGMESKRHSTDTCQPAAEDNVDAKDTDEIVDRDAAAAAAAASDVECTTEHTVSQRRDDAENRQRRVMNGRLDNLPPLQSKIVRIFTSSTFTGQPLIYVRSIQPSRRPLSHVQSILQL